MVYLTEVLLLTNVFKCNSNFISRDHFFDSDERAVKKRRKKKSTISKPDEPVRGAVTLRSLRYKINEEKINPRDRLAVPTLELPVRF